MTLWAAGTERTLWAAGTERTLWAPGPTQNEETWNSLTNRFLMEHKQDHRERSRPE